MSSDRVTVAVRLRPPCPPGDFGSSSGIWRVCGAEIEQVSSSVTPNKPSSSPSSTTTTTTSTVTGGSVTTSGRRGKISGDGRRRRHAFRYDHVFDASVDNESLYATLAAPLVSRFLSGKHATIFAYGQTSSGKTHSMLGGPTDLGIIPRALIHILSSYHSSSSSSTTEQTLSMSYLEIYNDRLRDLLNPSLSDLHIRDLPSSIQIPHLTVHPIEHLDDAMTLLHTGQAVRHVSDTPMNPRSSRSHTILQIHLHTASQHGRNSRHTLHLVDLAGSERVKNTRATGQTLREGGHINQSLLTLGTIVSKLSKQSTTTNTTTTTTTTTQRHLPFRDCKLTRLLRPALLGDASIVVLATMSSNQAFVEESLSTLKFAARAKLLKTSDPAPVSKPHDVDYRARYTEMSTEVMGLRKRFAEMEEELAKLRVSTTTTTTTSVVVDEDHTHVVGDASPSVTASTTTCDSSPSSSDETDEALDEEAVDTGTMPAPTSTISTTSPSSSFDHEEEGSSTNSNSTPPQAVRLQTLQTHAEDLENENEHLRSRLRVLVSELCKTRLRLAVTDSAARRRRRDEMDNVDVPVVLTECRVDAAEIDVPPADEDGQSRRRRKRDVVSVALQAVLSPYENVWF